MKNELENSELMDYKKMAALFHLGTIEDFTIVKKQLNYIHSNSSKINHLLEVKTDYIQSKNKVLPPGSVYCDEFTTKCDLEIDKLKSLQPNEINNITEPSGNDPQPEINVCTQIEKNQIIDDILNQMFTLTDFELTTLKSNLNGGRKYINLVYIGKKEKLWSDLGNLLSSGVDRKTIADVFSSYCKWKTSHASAPIDLKYDEIYKKIAKKGTN